MPRPDPGFVSTALPAGLMQLVTLDCFGNFPPPIFAHKMTHVGCCCFPISGRMVSKLKEHFSDFEIVVKGIAGRDIQGVKQELVPKLVWEKNWISGRVVAKCFG
jgi:hypothetical protein